MDSVSIRRILVVGPAWVGDMVMAQSLFMALRQRLPQASIDVLAPAWSLPLLGRMPQVRRGIALPVAHRELALGKRLALARELRLENYEHAIVLPRSLKAALIPFLARIPLRTGFRGEWRYGMLNDIRPLDRRVLNQTVQRFVALGLPRNAALPPAISPPRLQVHSENQHRLSKTLGLDLSRPVIAMMPGAEYGPAKRWPASYYGTLAAGLTERGYHIWLLGSERDRKVAEEVAEAARSAVVNLCGRTALEDVIDLLALAEVAVTNDSGLMHVAGAVDTPVIALYGSSTPDYTPPLGHGAVVMYDRLRCSPCFKRTCPKRHTRCLTGITPDRVREVLDAMRGVRAA